MPHRTHQSLFLVLLFDMQILRRNCAEKGALEVADEEGKKKKAGIP